MQTARLPCNRLLSSISKQRPGILSSRNLSHTLSGSHVSSAVIRLPIHPSRCYRAPPAMEASRAPFLSTLQQNLTLDSPWGFVVYRTTAYAPNETATWEAFQQKFNLLVQESFDNAAGPGEEIAAARKSWTVRWEEDTNMAQWTLEDVKRHYDGLFESKTLPEGLSHPLCLVATSAAVKSVLDAPSPMPRYEYTLGGHGAPFLVGIDLLVDLDEEDEDDDMKYEGRFNVSVQCLLDGLWPMLAEQLCDVEELGRGVQENQVWGM